MTGTRSLRVRARRNQNGSLLEWHPADVDEVEELLEKPGLVIVTLYELVDRRLVSDGDVVATVDVWPVSGEVEEIQVQEDVHRDRSAWIVDDVRQSIYHYARGVAT
jgi:hypothetical protein